MSETRTIEPIAYFYSDFKEKFGIPRQSGRSPSLKGKVVFTEKYRVKEALNEIETFSHLWIIFDFSRSRREEFSPTVRPPRLGGNKRVGVFASRSPFRPNGLGLSVVKLEEVAYNERDGYHLILSGIDILDGSAVYDIKPYIPYADCKPNAAEGYTSDTKEHKLSVDFPEELLEKIDAEKRQALVECLADDPRTSYSPDGKIFKMKYACYDLAFKVINDLLIVISVSIDK